MLPGIFGVAFDFGYGGLLALLGWCAICYCAVVFTYFVSTEAKEEWEVEDILGREALLNRSFNRIS